MHTQDGSGCEAIMITRNHHRKHRSESVCKTESFDSFFVRKMTHWGLKCVTLVPSVSSYGHK